MVALASTDSTPRCHWAEKSRQPPRSGAEFASPHGAAFPGEVLVCSGGCASEPLDSACPPLPLRRVGSEGACECSREAEVLNCGGGALLYGRADDGTQRCNAQGTHLVPELQQLRSCLWGPCLDARTRKYV